jgi:ABC-2 family transporter protein
MIKALVKKELRENVMVAALGMVGAILLTAWTYHDYKAFIAISPDHPREININMGQLQPVVWPAFLMQLAGLCGIFGAALGFMQVFHERHRDLWGYLIHRPATRTQIFLGKMIAGLALYFIAIGLPLGVFVIWDATPGHVAAPFDWGMVSPMVKMVAGGVAFYFAGMLTGLRQARWWVSRALGLGLALGSVFLSFSSFEDLMPMMPFWQWLLWTGLCVGVLALAGWGSFLSHGEYRGQPRLGKLALTAAMFVGAAMALAFAYKMGTNLLVPERQTDYAYRSYHMTTNGEIIMQVRRNSMANEYFDLAGKPLISAKTGKPLNDVEFHQEYASQAGTQVNLGDRPRSQWYYDNYGDVFFVPVRSVPGRLWYFWRETGRLIEYDVQSRMPVASLGPDGYADDVQGKGERFVDSSAFDNRSDSASRLLYTRTTAYEANLDERTIKPIFATTTNEPIGAMAELIVGKQFSYPTIIAPEGGGFSALAGPTFTPVSTNILLVTRNFIHVLDPGGAGMLKADYKPSYPDYASVTVNALQPPGRYAVWFEPTVSEERKKELGLKTQVTWYNENSTLAKSETIPDVPSDPPQKPTLSDTLANLWMPWAVLIPAEIFDDPKPGWLAAVLTCIGTLASVGVGWWVGRRYSMSRGGLIGWGIFILVLNVFGLATFLCVQEWPARERCPNCKKLRVVDRTQCEHCGVDFAPAERNGTEIFEPLGAG